jgi:ABC-type oligopeptide transport system ATPase subunit
MLEFKEVSKEYSGGMFGTKRLKAVDGVSFAIAPHERVGLVGESGCGKSTVARMAGRLLLPSAGRVMFNGEDIMKMDGEKLKAYRRQMQMIFQNPQQSFSPRMRLYDTIAEPLRVHKLAKGKSAELERIRPAMEQVGLTEDIFSRFPHEISGGQAQRLAIMRILMLDPKLIIADEPTSMLDVSVQAQILSLLTETMDRLNSSLLFISHDLEVVRAVCDRIIVMQNGKICEIDTTENIFEHPKHEYTSFLVQNYRK